MVTTKQVHGFKKKFCDENEIIIQIINLRLQSYLKSTILDVGCGIGDIAYHTMQRNRAMLIDTNKPSHLDYPTRSRHRRYRSGFYEFQSNEIQTIFIAHTMQFIDLDEQRFRQKVLELNPRRIILILNDNIGLFGEIIKWVTIQYPSSHPEKHGNYIPEGYEKEHVEKFTTKIACTNFNQLSEQISYITLIPKTEEIAPLKAYLRQRLKSPCLSFDQTISIYEKDSKKHLSVDKAV
jgi:hypothetical protein